MHTIRDTQSLDTAITAAVAAARAKLMSMGSGEQPSYTAIRDAMVKGGERSLGIQNRPRPFPMTTLDFLDT